MANYKQGGRPLAVTTPLGEDKLLLETITGVEAVSRPFQFELTMIAQPDFVVPFDKLLGQKVSVRLDTSDTEKRYFSGIVARLSEGAEVLAADSGDRMLRYWCQVVPSFWLLKYKVDSRMFQHLSVLDILKKVLVGFDVVYEAKETYEKRDYCVQYHESDFDFASRLMEEEGLWYFFRHTSSGHTLVISDSPESHKALPEKEAVPFTDFSGQRDKRMTEDRIFGWQKSQEIRSAEYKAWDHAFQMPEKNFEAAQAIVSTVSVGTVSHSLKTGNDKLLLYEYPGAYAKSFDDIDRGGAEQASELQKIFSDAKRIVKVRMQQETQASLTVVGEGNVRRMLPGFKFKLEGHQNANGGYVLTEVNHSASMEGTYTTTASVSLKYANRFTCLPAALPCRPARTFAKPIVHGSQTARVVGDTQTSEIFTDKYGRIKVQFPWDREGKKNLDSSCWVRVAQAVAGKQWGSIFLPRVGQEVIVAFLEGDPDQPIVTGCVYNAEQMPPYVLPDNKTRSTIKTRSTEKGTAENFNELRFEDKKDSEEIYFHAEKDFMRVVENNDVLKVGYDKKDKGDQTIEVYNDRTLTVEQGNESYTVKTGNRSVTIDTGNETKQIKQGNRSFKIDQGNEDYELGVGNRTVTVKTGNEVHQVKVGKFTVEAGTAIELKVGSNSIVIDQMGVTIKGIKIDVKATAKYEVNGPLGTVGASGPLTVQGAIVKIN